MTDIIEDAIELSEQAKAKGTFNILDVIRDNGLPKDVVSIVVDENSAYSAFKLEEQLQELMESEDNVSQSEVDEIRSKISAIVETMNASRHTVHIKGISEGKRSELIELSLEKFPREYREKKGAIASITEEVEVQSPERDEYFTDLLWKESIEKIVAPDGREQNEITMDFIREFRSAISLPINAKITTSIEKLRIGTAAFIATADEDFLAKP